MSLFYFGGRFAKILNSWFYRWNWTKIWLLKKLSESFLYEGERSADFSAIPSASYLNSLLSRMVEGSTIDEAEEFATASIFNRKIIHRGAMLVHSSALVFDGKAYLFSADSGVGKSTHTKMWLKDSAQKLIFSMTISLLWKLKRSPAMLRNSVWRRKRNC